MADAICDHRWAECSDGMYCELCNKDAYPIAKEALAEVERLRALCAEAADDVDAAMERNNDGTLDGKKGLISRLAAAGRGERK